MANYHRAQSPYAFLAVNLTELLRYPFLLGLAVFPIGCCGLFLMEILISRGIGGGARQMPHVTPGPLGCSLDQSLDSESDWKEQGSSVLMVFC